MQQRAPNAVEDTARDVLDLIKIIDRLAPDRLSLTDTERERLELVRLEYEVRLNLTEAIIKVTTSGSRTTKTSLATHVQALREAAHDNHDLRGWSHLLLTTVVSGRRRAPKLVQP